MRQLFPLLTVLLGFNPRICKRCDPKEIKTKLEALINVSIHASVKDATPCL